VVIITIRHADDPALGIDDHQALDSRQRPAIGERRTPEGGRETCGSAAGQRQPPDRFWSARTLSLHVSDAKPGENRGGHENHDESCEAVHWQQRRASRRRHDSKYRASRQKLQP